MKPKKPFFFILTLILGILVLLLFMRFTIIIISCFFIAYMIKPLYNLIKSLIKNKSASALISEILFFSTIILILGFTINSLWTQIISVSSPLLAQNLISLENMTFLSFNLTSIDFTNPFTQETISSIGSSVQKLLSSTPQAIIDIFLITYITYYFIKGDKAILDLILKLVPRNSKDNIKRFVHKVDALTKDIIYGYFLTALIIGLLTFILLTILDINYSLDYALFNGIASIIPVIGNWIIPLFLSIYYFLNKNYLFSIIFIIFALTTSSLAKMIRPIISRTKYKIHPILFILGVVVGFYSLGIFGFLIGPILFSIIQTGFEEILV